MSSFGSEVQLRVGVVIPALNEAEALPGVLAALRDWPDLQVVVADNGSTDLTAAVAAAGAATVVREPMRGYGAACVAGVRAIQPNRDIVVFVDADGSDDLSALPEIVAPIVRDGADLVMGARARAQREVRALTAPQRLGTALAVLLIRLRWGRRFQDLGPFRAIRRAALDQLDMRDRAFGWTLEMQIRAIQCGLTIIERPVAYRRRQRGKSKISGTIRGVWRAGWCILTTFTRLAVRSTQFPPASPDSAPRTASSR